MVVCDFGSALYEKYNADWEHYHIWKARINEERRKKGGLLKQLLNTL